MSAFPTVKLHGYFIGVLLLKEDMETYKQQITLKKLRYLILDCLQLHPFMQFIEKQLIEEIELQYELREASLNIDNMKLIDHGS